MKLDAASFYHSLTGRRKMKVREFEAAIAYLGDLASKENASAFANLPPDAPSKPIQATLSASEQLLLPQRS